MAGHPEHTINPERDASGWQVGAAVMLSGRGLGTIVGRTICAPLGVQREYLQIEITCTHMTVRVPVDMAEEAGLRAPDTSASVHRALDVLADLPQGVTDVSWQKRIKVNHEKLTHGSTFAAAEVLRGLCVRALRRPLGMQERDQQSLAIRLLEGQIMHALDLAEGEANALLAERLPTREEIA